MEKIPCEVKFNKQEACNAELELLIPSIYIDGRYEREMNKLKKKVKIKGFREGKAPKEMVERFYGADTNSKVVNSVLSEAAEQALVENNDWKVYRIIGVKDSQKVDGGLLSFKLSVEVFPEFELKEYKDIEVKRLPVDVEKSEVDKEIELLRDHMARLLPVTDDREITDSDYVLLDYEFYLKEDDTKKKQSSKGVLAKVGEERFIEGFEDGLKGMKQGETKTLELKFPEDYFDKAVAGKEAVFDVTTNEIKQKVLEEKDDELAKAVGMESAEKMRERIEEQLKAEKERKSREELEREVKKQLIEKNPLDLPESMIASRKHNLMDIVARSLKTRAGYTDEMVKKYLEEWDNSFQERAVEELKSEFIIDRIGTEENISVEDADLEKKYEELSKTAGKTPEEVGKFYKASDERLDGLRLHVRNEKTMEYIISVSRVN